LLIENLREAATHNNLSTQFSAIEELDEDTCVKITGFYFEINIFLKISET